MKKPSIFEEYSNLLRKGFKDFDKVIASRWNSSLDAFNLLDTEKKTVAENRLNTCLTCPFNSVAAKTSPEFTELFQRGTLALIDDPVEHLQATVDFEQNPAHYFTNRSDSDLHCCWCGCPVDKKVLAMDESCGLVDYNLTYRQSQELKWAAQP